MKATVLKSCRNCSKPFWAFRCVAAARRYCSKACYTAFTRSIEGAIVRFWEKIEKKPNGCWEFKVRNVQNYGKISTGWGKDMKQYLAHRFAWRVYYGEFAPAEMMVCHHCDNPPCVRKEHLFLGTRADNAMDKILKGRDPTACLNADQVRDARRLLATNSQKDVARMLGVLPGVINDLALGYTYGWVIDEPLSHSPRSED